MTLIRSLSYTRVTINIKETANLVVKCVIAVFLLNVFLLNVQVFVKKKNIT